MNASASDFSNGYTDSAGRLTAHIDLDAIAANWTTLDGLSKGAKAGGVVKADGYGHGMIPVAKALAKAGCELFFTAAIDEAIELRTALPQHRIGYFDGLHENHQAAITDLNLMPSINTPKQLKLLAGFAAEQNRPIPAMLQLDTGMNRTGAGPDCVGDMLNAPDLAAGDWRLLFSHLAAADEPDHPFNQDQRQRFEALIASAPKAPLSLAATGGILLGDDFHYDVTRPGLGLYGISPHPACGNLLTPALTLSALVLQTRHAKAGETVGYGGAYRLQRDSRLATIAGGYGDGISRKLSRQRADDDGGQIEKDGFIAPMIGRVSMDAHVVDVTDWPPQSIKEGDQVMLINSALTASDLAAKIDTIPYEILTTLGLRAKRLYAEGNKILK
jgi:alanine racemase